MANHDLILPAKGFTTKEVEHNFLEKISKLENMIMTLETIDSFEITHTEYIGIYETDPDLFDNALKDKTLYNKQKESFKFTGKSWKEVKTKASIRLSFNYIPKFETKTYIKLI